MPYFDYIALHYGTREAKSGKIKYKNIKTGQPCRVIGGVSFETPSTNVLESLGRRHLKKKTSSK